jgi:uncharacterized Zn finger protein (UPF0148 family)
MKRPYVDNSMYSGTPCDKCGGPTYRLRTGSIWCSAEDPHPGGHFVMRIGMIPNRDGATRGEPIKPRAIKPRTPATVSKPKVEAPMIGGYDDFVEGSDR